MPAAKITFLLGFSFLLSACGWNPLSSKEEYVRRGRNFAAHGRLDDAAFQFRKALQKDSKYGDAYLRYGQTLALQNNTPQALKSFLRAAELMPGSQEAKVELGRAAVTALMRDPRHPKVLREIAGKASDQLLAANPKSSEGLRLKGFIAIADSNPEAAINSLRNALAINPKLPEVATVLAQTLLFSHQDAEAESVVRKGIIDFPAYGPLYDLLYSHLMASNRADEAERLLRLKIAHNRAEAFFVIQLADHFWACKQPRQAEELLQAFVANRADYPAASLDAGDFYRRIGRPEQAIQLYQTGLKSPGDKARKYLQAIVAVRLSQGHMEEAAQAIETLLKQFPADVEALASRADLRMASGNAGQMQQALSELSALARKEPAPTHVLESLAHAYRQLDRDREAQSSFQEILQRDPRNRAALRELADLSIRDRKPEEALRYAERLLELDPANTGARLVRTSAWALRGRFSEVRPELRRLTSDFPDQPEPWLQLAALDVETKDYTDAEQIFLRLYQSRKGDIRPVKGLLLVYMSQGQGRKAVTFAREEAARRSDPQFRTLLAATAAQTGDDDLALTTALNLASDFPGNADHLVFAGQIYLRKGQTDAAVSTFRKARLLAPANPGLLAQLAGALSQAGRQDEAIAISREGLRLSPEDPNLLNGLAWNLAVAGRNLEEAAMLARHALEKDPFNDSYKDTAGFIAMKSGKLDMATSAFRQLVARQGDVAIYRVHLAEALTKTAAPR